LLFFVFFDTIKKKTMMSHCIIHCLLSITQEVEKGNGGAGILPVQHTTPRPQQNGILSGRVGDLSKSGEYLPRMCHGLVCRQGCCIASSA
jgi:hypothetical protein